MRVDDDVGYVDVVDDGGLDNFFPVTAINQVCARSSNLCRPFESSVGSQRGLLLT